MTTVAHPPLSISTFRREVLALRFGASVEDQSARSIANPYDRERYLKRVEYENAMLANSCALLFMCYGSTDWTLGGIATRENREAAERRIATLRDEAKMHHRELLRFPLILKEKGIRDSKTPENKRNDLLKPFSEPIIEYTEGPPSEMPPPSARDVRRATRDRLIAPPEARVRYTCLVWESPDETTENVPAENIDEVNEALASYREHEQVFFERTCKRFGATDWGTLEGIPDAAKRAEAIRFFLARQMQIEARCFYELQLTRINIGQHNAKPTTPRQAAVLSLKGITTADLLAD